MRLVTLDSREVGGRPGISLPSGEILDLAASPAGLTAAQWRPQSVVSVLAEGEEGSARVARLLAEVDSVSESQRQEWRRSGRLLPAAGTRLMPPIRRPGLLLMVIERNSGRSSCYVKNPNSAAGPDTTIPQALGGEHKLFMLGMIGLVVGRPLFRATEAQAARAVAALTLVADLGTRRLAGGADEDRGDARQFPGACVIGPALVTLDELPAAAAWELVVRVNGRTVGSGRSDLNAGTGASILANLSSRYAFRPGDIVGVPAGVGEFELPAASQVALSLGSTLELRFATSG
jgi:Fumarylacetoacetate (FAA) hydrolase family